MDRQPSTRAPYRGAVVRRLVVAVLLVVSLALVAVLPASAASGYWSRKDLAGKVVTSVAVSPTNSSILLAGTRGYGVYRSTNRGATWTRVNLGLTNLYVNEVEFDPRNPSIAYAVAGRGGGIGDTNGGIFRSVNGGVTWVRKVSGFSEGLVVSTSYPNVVYAVGGLSISGKSYQVARSVDRGLTWRGQGGDFHDADLTAVAVDPTYSPIVVVGGTTEGGAGYIFSSANGGATWHWSYNGSGATRPTDIVSLAFNRDGTAVYAAADSKLLRSKSDGVAWTSINTAASGASFLSVLGGRTNPAELFVGTSGSVWRSASYGSSLTRLDSPIGLAVYDLSLDRLSPRTLYAATASGVWAYTFR